MPKTIGGFRGRWMPFGLAFALILTAMSVGAASANAGVNARASYFTNAGTTTFVQGVQSNYAVVFNSSNVTLSASGSFPSGIGFVDNKVGTGTFSGTATQTGTFSIGITATANKKTVSFELFTLNVVSAPTSTTTAPTPTTLPAVGGTVKIAAVVIASTATSATKVTVSCSGARICSGSVKLQIIKTVKVRVKNVLVTQHKTITLGTSNYKIAEGTKGTPTVRLNATGKLMLAKSHRLAVNLVVNDQGKLVTKRIVFMSKP